MMTKYSFKSMTEQANAIKENLISPVKLLEEFFEKLRKEQDSIGAKILIRVEGLMPGVGSPVFSKLDAELAKSMMGVNAVKAVELGSGVGVVEMKGSENRDLIKKDGFETNNSGGILGGISNEFDIQLSNIQLVVIVGITVLFFAELIIRNINKKKQSPEEKTRPLKKVEKSNEISSDVIRQKIDLAIAYINMGKKSKSISILKKLEKYQLTKKQLKQINQLRERLS